MKALKHGCDLCLFGGGNTLELTDGCREHGETVERILQPGMDFGAPIVVPYDAGDGGAGHVNKLDDSGDAADDCRSLRHCVIYDTIRFNCILLEF